jgi:polyferredoxin
MLDSRKNYRKITGWIAAVTVGAITVTACLSNTYNTQSIIGLCVAFLLLCIIGISYKTTAIQHLRPLILFCSLIYFGFMVGGCSCLLFYFQGFILFLTGKTVFWLSFVIIIAILVLSVIFGPIWCGWLCWLGALQEFIFRQNKWKLLSTKKAQKILIYIQTVAFVSLVIWVIFAQRPVLCAYDPFISIFRLRIFNWIGYITVPLLLLSSLFIYRPFCRIFCPIGWLLYIIKFIPFATKLKITKCTDCRKCHTYCKFNAIHNKQIDKTCMMCGECKDAKCFAP